MKFINNQNLSSSLIGKNKNNSLMLITVAKIIGILVFNILFSLQINKIGNPKINKFR